MKKAEALSKLRRRLAAQSEYRCGYCLTSERLTGIRLTLDHLIPLAVGGHTDESNLWMACRACNEFKGTQTHAQDPKLIAPFLFSIHALKLGASTLLGAQRARTSSD